MGAARVVIDTNILVASLWKPDSKSADVVRDALGRALDACYDDLMMREYGLVLRRLRFRFPLERINGLINGIAEAGTHASPPKSEGRFAHEGDRAF